MNIIKGGKKENFSKMTADDILNELKIEIKENKMKINQLN